MSNNTPAFPRPFSQDESRIHLAHRGMTLLDYFAGQALTGLLADPSVYAEEKTAAIAYKMAGFMLAEREKHNK
jgi:hypothetical protein